jgi:acyl-CoA dehydrogenase
MPYVAPVADLLRTLSANGQLDRVLALPGYAQLGIGREEVAAVLEEAGRLATNVLEPINRSGDLEGSRVTPEGVIAAKGFKEAYAQFVAGGWPALAAPETYGGQGLPHVVGTAVGEQWPASNMAFGLCSELSVGGMMALEAHGSEELKARWLPPMISGQFSGTMCLSEPQAGSDLGVITTRAEPDGDMWKLFGRKIWITWGEHDMAENTVHFVLARAVGSPAGTKGLSLFLVPRYLDGSANDVHCVSVEHKLGIKASPTCVMAFGDNGGARGWLVGNLNQGINNMFTMMNVMRLGVGLQAIGLMERAYQHALGYAKERVQGRNTEGGKARIIEHADVRRMLLEMRALTSASRGIAMMASATIDISSHSEDPVEREAARVRGDLLTPIVKAFPSESALKVTSHAIQVWGGMGFVEETGVAQYYRDSRIIPIYEGTNGIQAADLIGRKTTRDAGAGYTALLNEIAAFRGDKAGVAQAALQRFVARLREVLPTVLAGGGHAAFAGAVAHDFLMATGHLVGLYALVRNANDPLALPHDEELAASHAAHLLPQAYAHLEVVLAGGDAVAAFSAEAF